MLTTSVVAEHALVATGGGERVRRVVMVLDQDQDQDQDNDRDHPHAESDPGHDAGSGGNIGDVL